MRCILFSLTFFLSTNLFAQKVHEDKEGGYSVVIPEWLKVVQLEDKTLFGGTLPPVANIENAILIKVFKKGEFESFDDFKRIYITGHVFGKPTLYNKDQIFFGRNQNDLKEIPKGVRSRLFYRWQNNIYHAHYVVLELPETYLWIQFIATPETYETNLPKFEEFLNGLKTN